MKRKILILLSLSLIISLGIGFLWLKKENSVKAENPSQLPHPLETINQKAKNARSGNLLEAKELVGEIIRVAGFEREIQGFSSGFIKDRVGRAESRYRQGQVASIPETKIVRTVNGLVKKFNLPEYTKTNLYEVRKLRLTLLPNFPQLITRKSQNIQPTVAGAEIDPQMSPAEATFVLAFMLRQKLSNQDYQLTYAEQMNRWAETHNHRAGQSNSPHPAQNRSRETRDALSRAIASTSASDA